MAHLHLVTADGFTLAADVTDGTGPSAIVCHPDPRFGGDRHHLVVDAVFRALDALGCRALRFDFRREPSGIGDGLADLEAAVTHLRTTGAPDCEIHLIGYSFGAQVAVGAMPHDALGPIASLTLIAPPDPPEQLTGVRALVIVPTHDQFCAPRTARRATAGWRPTPEVVELQGADHFLQGFCGVVAALVSDFVGGTGPATGSAPDLDPS